MFKPTCIYYSSSVDTLWSCGLRLTSNCFIYVYTLRAIRPYSGIMCRSCLTVYIVVKCKTLFYICSCWMFDVQYILILVECRSVIYIGLVKIQSIQPVLGFLSVRGWWGGGGVGGMKQISEVEEKTVHFVFKGSLTRDFRGYTASRRCCTASRKSVYTLLDEKCASPLKKQFAKLNHRGENNSNSLQTTFWSKTQVFLTQKLLLSFHK